MELITYVHPSYFDIRRDALYSKHGSVGESFPHVPNFTLKRQVSSSSSDSACSRLPPQASFKRLLNRQVHKAHPVCQASNPGHNRHGQRGHLADVSAALQQLRNLEQVTELHSQDANKLWVFIQGDENCLQYVGLVCCCPSCVGLPCPSRLFVLTERCTYDKALNSMHHLGLVHYHICPAHCSVGCCLIK
jgi:hypothetical protein